MMEENFSLDLGKFLINYNALKFGEFKLSSGITSKYYIDLRIIPSFPYMFRKIINEFKFQIFNNKEISEFDIIGTVPTSGLIYGSALAFELYKPLVYVRKESKTYGTTKMIEGKIDPKSKILIIDDVVTTGHSIKNAITHLQNNNMDIKNILVIIDRGKKDANADLINMGINIIALTTISKIAVNLYNNNLIDEHDFKTLKEN